MEIIRYDSFAKAQYDWENLEKTSFHYLFQSWWYQRLFATHFSKSAKIFILGIQQEKQQLAIGAFEIIDEKIQFLGTKNVSSDASLVQDITDFGDLLFSPEGKQQAKEIWQLIANYFTKQHFQALQLNYIRHDSPTYKALEKISTQCHQQETSPFIVLPKTWDEYLTELGRKKRHELKRKMHRLMQVDTLFTKDVLSKEVFDTFIKLHKLSDIQKKKFMTPSMENFFWDMVTEQKTGWETVFYTLSINNLPVAMIMVFENDNQVLLYNSGFDPAYAFYSVGLLVKAFLLKKSIEQGKSIYDFLRGDERYKYDLGAKDMPLFQISGSLLS